MKLNINHNENYLDGYVNLEKNGSFKTDHVVEDYVINSVSGTESIQEIICHPGALEKSKAGYGEILKSWANFSSSSCTLKAKCIDIEALANALSSEVIDSEMFNSMVSGYLVFFDRHSFTQALSSAGFKPTKTWYGPHQWVLNVEAKKQ
jgi:hypothetical protein